MICSFDINFCKQYHLQQELPFLHITIYRWKISPSSLTRYFNTLLFTTKWRQYETMITETKIELSSLGTRLQQKTPLYHSVTDKSQKLVDSTCCTHNTQNDANHGVSGLVKSLRRSMLLQNHQRQHTKRQTKNLQRGSSVHWGDFFIEIAANFNDTKQKFLIDTGSMVSIIKPNLINTAAILSSTTTLSTVKRDSIKVHGQVTLLFKIPSLQRCINHELYVANVSCNILGMDFQK